MLFWGKTVTHWLSQYPADDNDNMHVALLLLSLTISVHNNFDYLIIVMYTFWVKTYRFMTLR